MLLDALIRDSKCAFIKERSNRDEIMHEILDTLVTWVSDIWTVVYEHQVHFREAHNCLLIAASIVGQISTIPSPMGGQVFFIFNAI